jgi:hypothetical protein
MISYMLFGFKMSLVKTLFAPRSPSLVALASHSGGFDSYGALGCTPGLDAMQAHALSPLATRPLPKLFKILTNSVLS